MYFKAVKLELNCSTFNSKRLNRNWSWSSFTAILTISGQTLVWPKECNEILEIEIAQKIIQSELLVQEDQVCVHQSTFFLSYYNLVLLIPLAELVTASNKINLNE
jgi:hypothetical protein